MEFRRFLYVGGIVLAASVAVGTPPVQRKGLHTKTGYRDTPTWFFSVHPDVHSNYQPPITDVWLKLGHRKVCIKAKLQGFGFHVVDRAEYPQLHIPPYAETACFQGIGDGAGDGFYVAAKSRVLRVFHLSFAEDPSMSPRRRLEKSINY
jgi:hypothetical protein